MAQVVLAHNEGLNNAVVRGYAIRVKGPSETKNGLPCPSYENFRLSYHTFFKAGATSLRSAKRANERRSILKLFALLKSLSRLCVFLVSTISRIIASLTARFKVQDVEHVLP
jgi:hypothetical protein